MYFSVSLFIYIFLFCHKIKNKVRLKFKMLIFVLFYEDLIIFSSKFKIKSHLEHLVSYENDNWSNGCICCD